VRRAAATVATVLLVASLIGCSSSQSGSAAAFCPLVKDLGRFDTIFDSFDNTDSTRALAQLEQGRSELVKLRDAAPGEIKDDLSVLIDLVDKLIKAVHQVDPKHPETARAAVAKISKDFTKADAANVTLESFRQTNCVTDPTSSTTSTTAGAVGN
jgi:hypothetical protein